MSWEELCILLSKFLLPFSDFQKIVLNVERRHCMLLAQMVHFAGKIRKTKLLQALFLLKLEYNI